MTHPRPQPAASAEKAALTYVTDAQTGIRRVRRGRGFAYYAPDGRLIRDPGTRRRIDALAVPPAWQDVWICTDPQGHLQASGRDARGRKQYRYHPRWREVRDAQKFAGLASFGATLPRLRRRVTADLGRPGMPLDKVVAVIVRLLDRAYLRVGDESYVRANRSYGATTLRNRHARLVQGAVQLRFRAKSGRLREVQINNPRLVRLVRRCRELPGHRLFEYLDDAGEVRSVSSGDVNAYLEAVTGAPVTSKDFRTWAGTLVALRSLSAAPAPRSAAGAERAIHAAVDAAAAALGNTAAVCRRSYVHPQVLQRYRDDPAAFRRRVAQAEARPVNGLRAGERGLLRLLDDAVG